MFLRLAARLLSDTGAFGVLGTGHFRLVLISLQEFAQGRFSDEDDLFRQTARRNAPVSNLGKPAVQRGATHAQQARRFRHPQMALDTSGSHRHGH